jgi:hypothetical protein
MLYLKQDVMFQVEAGVVVQPQINVTLEKETVIPIQIALGILNVELTIVVLTFLQALIVASFPRGSGIDGYTRCWWFFFITFPTSFRQCVFFNLLFV